MLLPLVNFKVFQNNKQLIVPTMEETQVATEEIYPLPTTMQYKTVLKPKLIILTLQQMELANIMLNKLFLNLNLTLKLKLKILPLQLKLLLNNQFLFVLKLIKMFSNFTHLVLFQKDVVINQIIVLLLLVILLMLGLLEILGVPIGVKVVMLDLLELPNLDNLVFVVFMKNLLFLIINNDLFLYFYIFMIFFVYSMKI